MIELNPQRQNYLDTTGKIVLKACPGSGKTTIISYKLHNLIKNHDSALDGGIACLSFTNVAKDEINQKYHEFAMKPIAYPHVVSTIDSFINTYVTLPFYYLLKKDANSRPTILDDNSDINSYAYGYKIADLYQYDPEAEKRLPKHKNKNDKYLMYAYPPSDIQKDTEGNYTFKGVIPKSDKVDIEIFNDYCKIIKAWQFKNDILTHYDATNFGLKILRDFPAVTNALSRRFSHIVIDEAQDTSEIQHAILECLMNAGLKNLELVGDPYQCLYMWRDAKPRIFREKYCDALWKGLDLSDNWRSTQQIINAYSRMRNASDEEIIAKVKTDIAHPVYILQFEENCEDQALEKYHKLCLCYKNNQAVTRGKDLSERLSNLSNTKKNFWKHEVAEKIIAAIIALKKNEVKSAIDTMRFVMVELCMPKLSYREKRESIKELKGDYDTNALLHKLLIELSDFTGTLAEWTLSAETSLSDSFNLKAPFSLNLKKSTFTPKHKMLMSQLFDENLKWNFPISTIHKVKGMSLDTILLFLGHTGHSLSLNDIIPSTGDLTENQSLIYVAMSRPRHLLAIAICDKVDVSDITKKLGDKVKII